MKHGNTDFGEIVFLESSCVKCSQALPNNPAFVAGTLEALLRNASRSQFRKVGHRWFPEQSASNSWELEETRRDKLAKTNCGKSFKLRMGRLGSEEKRKEEERD